MNTLDRETIADHFKSFQAQIYERIEGFEDNKSFIKDGWEKQNLGSGLSIVVDDGQVFNKAGINFSQIAGDSLPDSSLGILNESEKLLYFATGVSVVFHPNNPNIPTAHLNVRYFAQRRMVKFIIIGLVEDLTLLHIYYLKKIATTGINQLKMRATKLTLIFTKPSKKIAMNTFIFLTETSTEVWAAYFMKNLRSHWIKAFNSQRMFVQHLLRHTQKF